MRTTPTKIASGMVAATAIAAALIPIGSASASAAATCSGLHANKPYLSGGRVYAQTSSTGCTSTVRLMMYLYTDGSLKYKTAWTGSGSGALSTPCLSGKHYYSDELDASYGVSVGNATYITC